MLVSMQRLDASCLFTLSDPRLVRMLRQPAGLKVLGAFMQGAQPLSPVAKQLGMTMPTALRWARRWLDVGALEVAEEVARAGRAVKWYRAVAPALFVPYESEGDAVPEEVVRRIVAARVDAQARALVAASLAQSDTVSAPRWGTLVHLDGDGHLVLQPGFEGGRSPLWLDAHGPSTLNFHAEELRLSIAHAKKLQRELADLLKRYKAAPAGPQSYTLSIVLAPAADLSSKCGFATLLDPLGGRPASAGLGALKETP
jgi:hypothetical protein